MFVFCSDGVGRSGTFICMHAQMERMKSEAVVDVFQFIKSVRFQRAGLVANKVRNISRLIIITVGRWKVGGGWWRGCEGSGITKNFSCLNPWNNL